MRISLAKGIGAASVLVLLVLFSYGPAYNADFIVDDSYYVTDNPHLADAAGLGRLWFEIGATSPYYPLVFTTFWVEHHLWGDNPLGYHVNNVLLHALSAILLWVVLQRLSLPGAWFAAAVFALHPVHVESVAWVAERKNVLSAVFYLAAALSYLRFARLDNLGQATRSRWLHYIAALVLFCAALLSKTAVLSLPVALLLVIWWKRGRIDWRRDFPPLIPMFAVGLVLAIVTIHLESTVGGASGPLWDLSWGERILVAGRALWFYAFKLAWPMALSFNYPKWTLEAGRWWQALYPVSALGVVAWLWTARDRLGRGPLTGVLFFAITLVPTLGFFDVYFFRYSFVADHFQYLASIGLISLAVGSATRWMVLQPRGISRAATAAGCIVLAVLGGLTWKQAQVFESLEILSLDILRKNPSSWLANNNLGNIHMQRGELNQAVERFEIALEEAPTYIETHLNLSIVLSNLGRFGDAERHARQAIEIRPQNVQGYLRLGDVYLRSNQPGEAIDWYETALKLDPDLWKAELGQANALARLGRFEKAVSGFESVLNVEPLNITARVNLGIALVEVGRLEEAIAHLREADRLDPDNPAIRQNLEVALGRSAAEAQQRQ